jgi:uncharacterized membrane protein YqhA
VSGPAPDQDADGLPPGIDPSGLSSRSVQRSLAVQRRFERVLALSRLLVLIPVVFLLLDAAGSFIYGADILIRTADGDLGEATRVGGRLGVFLIVMDTFLVGATFMIAAFGFYELFVLRRERAGHRYWLPHWLQMHDLEDLKARVTSMLILVASITFVDILVESHDKKGVLYLGLGVAVMVVALTAFLRYGRRPEAQPSPVAPPAPALQPDPSGRPNPAPQPDPAPQPTPLAQPGFAPRARALPQHDPAPQPGVSSPPGPTAPPGASPGGQATSLPGCWDCVG